MKTIFASFAARTMVKHCEIVLTDDADVKHKQYEETKANVNSMKVKGKQTYAYRTHATFVRVHAMLYT